jgi:hypothetical protein
MTDAPPAAFYCVTGRDFFPGAVALLNSLRLVGHREPLFVLDCGMSAWQRELLAPHATIVTAPSDAPPSLLKATLPLSRPARTMVLLDADVIVTRPLTGLIEQAGAGRFVAFENDRPRFFAEWAQLLDLPSVPRRPYVTSSAVVVGCEPAQRVLPLADERATSVDRRGTWFGRGAESHPLYYLDQDVLNAVVASQLRENEVVVLDRRLSANPPFQGLRLRDRTALRCAYRDGAEPYLLHHWARKPWLTPVRRNLYSRLLTRLLLGPDVPVRVDPARLPLELRTGVAAEARRLRLDVTLAVPGVRRRILRREGKTTAWPG